MGGVLSGLEPSRDMRPSSLRMTGNHLGSNLLCNGQQIPVALQIYEPQEPATLALAEILAWASKLQIQIGDLEPVCMIFHYSQALSCGIGGLRVI